MFIRLCVVVGLFAVGNIAASAKPTVPATAPTSEASTPQGRPVIDSAASHSSDAARVVLKKKNKKGDEKSKKDSQNQTKFMKADMDAKDYNFYDRKKISTPLMPRYDLDSSVFQKGFKNKETQQKAYIQNKYHYPARPKDQWELGLHFGSHIIQGDISPDWAKGWGGGIYFRKAINYYFSLRFSYTYAWMQTVDWKPRSNAEFDGALNGFNGSPNYYNNHDLSKGPIQTDLLFHNYQTQMHTISLDGIVNLGNVLFHKERSLVNFNLIFGVGMQIYRVQMDLLGKDGKTYNFKPIVDKYNQDKADKKSESEIKSDVKALLASTLDGTYETDAEDAHSGWTVKLAKYRLDPVISVGGGFDFHVSKWATVGIEERATITNNDMLDGTQWQEDAHAGLTPNYDNIFYTSIHVGIHLGKNRVEPLYWLNPMDYTYKKLSDANPDKIAKEILKDTDEDGVPDRLDKEPNTKKGCPVDVKGVALDSDKDGIPDCDDKEPFSPPGYPVDQNGVAQLPPNPCCDNDTSGEGGGGAGKKKGKRDGYDCSKIEMPGVFFDDDKYYIGPEYLSALHQVAEKLQMCPDVKMVITGYDESKNNQKYNEQLAYNRAASVVDYLVEKYGVSRDRFIMKYAGGKKSNANKSPQERKESRKVDFTYAGDGEKGESNPPAPHPGLKAGSNK